MASVTCDVCGGSYPEIETLKMGSKTMCFGCESDLENTRKVARGIWVSIVSAPLTSLLGWPSILPGLMFFGGCAFLPPAFFGVTGTIFGIRCIVLSFRLRGQEADNGVSPLATNLLVAGGGIAILSGLGLVATSALLLLGAVAGGAL